MLKHTFISLPFCIVLGFFPRIFISQSLHFLVELAYLKRQVLILAPLQLLPQLLVLFNALLLERLKRTLHSDECFLLLSVDEVSLLLGDMGLLNELECPLVFVLKELYVLKLVDQFALRKWDLTFWL